MVQNSDMNKTNHIRSFHSNTHKVLTQKSKYTWPKNNNFFKNNSLHISLRYQIVLEFDTLSNEEDTLFQTA